MLTGRKADSEHSQVAIELTGRMSEVSRKRAPVETPAQLSRSTGPSGKVPREFDRRVARAAIIVNLVVLVTIVTALLVWRLRALLLLVIVSLFVSAMLHPVVSFVQRLGSRRNSARSLSRGVATTTVFFLAFLIAAGIGAVIVHPLITSATHFARGLPALVKQAQQGKGQVGHIVARLHLLKFVQSKQANLENIVSKLSRPALEIGRTVFSGLASAATIAVLTFFILLELPSIVRSVLAWMQPERSARARAVLDDVGRAVVGYVVGNLVTSLIAGLVVGTTLYILGVPFYLVLAIWVALVDFLPLIGGLVAGVPTVIVAGLHSLAAGIVTLVVFIVYQQIENHLLNPVVMSKTVKLNPLLVLLAVFVGAELGDFVGSLFGGLVGALIAVPTAAALQVAARDLWRHKTGETLLGLKAAVVPSVFEGDRD
jgi:predicted PurR-regulated permease PerM